MNDPGYSLTRYGITPYRYRKIRSVLLEELKKIGRGVALLTLAKRLRMHHFAENEIALVVSRLKDTGKIAIDVNFIVTLVHS
jgi:hypothetical protein